MLLILILDSILVYVNEFVPMTKLIQIRNDKINSEDTTETFVLSLFDLSVMSEIVDRVSTVKLFYF